MSKRNGLVPYLARILLRQSLLYIAHIAPIFRALTEFLGRIVLANVTELGVAANHICHLMLSLVHGLGIIGPAELADSDEGGASEGVSIGRP